MTPAKVPDGDDAIDRIFGRLRRSIGNGDPIKVSVERLSSMIGRVRAAAELASGTSSVLDATVTSIFAAGQIRPLMNQDNRYLAIAFARELVELNGCRIEPALRLVDLAGLDLQDPDLKGRPQLEDRLAAGIVHEQSGLPPADLHDRGFVLTEPLRGFIGCAVSHQALATLRKIEVLAVALEDALIGAAIRPYTAIGRANPAYEQDHFAYDPAVGFADACEVARSDVLILIHGRPSTGVGVNVAHGQATRAFTMFVEGSPLRSPLTASLGYGYKVVDFPPVDTLDEPELEARAPVLAEEVVGLLVQRLHELEQHRRTRLARLPAYGEEHRAVIKALGQRSDEEQAMLPVPPKRLGQLAGSLDLYAVAPREEQDLLRDALGLRREAQGAPLRGGLTAAELDVGLQVAKDERWSDSRLSRVISEASEFVLSAERRALFTDPDMWIRFQRSREL